jgi:hypothetical protein
VWPSIMLARYRGHNLAHPRSAARLVTCVGFPWQEVAFAFVSGLAACVLGSRGPFRGWSVCCPVCLHRPFSSPGVDGGPGPWSLWRGATARVPDPD